MIKNNIQMLKQVELDRERYLVELKEELGGENQN